MPEGHNFFPLTHLALCIFYGKRKRLRTIAANDGVEGMSVLLLRM